MLLFISLIVLFQIYINLVSSTTSHFTTVEGLVEYNGRSKFIDIYDPKAYYDLTKEKRAISQINRIDIYYNGSSKEGYNIFIDVDSSSIIGVMDDYEVCIKFISNKQNKLDDEDKK